MVQQPSLAQYRVPVFRELARRRGIRLRLLYGSRPDLPNAEPDGFEAEAVPLKIIRPAGQPIFWHRAQWQAVSSKTADVAILTWNTRYASLIPALLKARHEGVGTILWGHGYSKHEGSRRAAARTAVARLAACLLLYNQTAARQLVAEGWNPERIFVAPNSLDQQPIQAARAHWQNHPHELDAFRREAGIEGRAVVLYVSRLDPANRLDLLLKATEQLGRDHPELLVVVVGGGDVESRRLQELARTLGISYHIRFLGPIYEERMLAPWFLSATLFCYPANIGLSLLHAFGYGVPVVTSDAIASQNPEIEALEDGHNGILYKDGSVEALAESIGSLLGDPERAARMGATGRAAVLETWTLARMVDGMEAAVRYCARRRNSAVRCGSIRPVDAG
jgi:glycosyltransferase involved in cell wall biosynthesis